MEHVILENADIKILRILQEDASLPIAEIARRAGLSQTPAWRRMKRMREEGVILGITARIDREALGLGFVAYASVKLTVPSRENMEAFDALVRSWPEVVTCERITGAVDYVIKVVTQDIKAYDAFLRTKLLDGPLVSDVQSRIVIATIKDSGALPLPQGRAR